jgi:cytochrome c peroxidase
LKKQYRNILYLILILGTAYASCKKDDDKSSGTTPYEISTPSHFPDLYIDPDNPLTHEGVELGRMLYYDTLLDGVGNRKCADCHFQEDAFTSYGSNALAHMNLGWSRYYLWNGKIEGSLEDIMLFEVQEFFQTDLSKFNSNSNYRNLFKTAFDVDDISYKDLANALAQFERTKFSGDSKYDRYIKGAESLSTSELNGMNIFFTEKGDCFHCHGTALFTDGLFHNNGLDLNPELGRLLISGRRSDKGAFKSPTLRNIELTAPYMHDGRYETLEEVVDFYSEGLKYSNTIDPLMKGVSNGGVNLTDQEKTDLVAFLHCLTDTSFTSKPSLSNPFK